MENKTKMIRRTFLIEADQDAKISEIAARGEIDKSLVVQLALRLGLPEIETGDIRVVDLLEQRLKEAHKERISAIGAKERRR
jgi:hypothetical protein